MALDSRFRGNDGGSPNPGSGVIYGTVRHAQPRLAEAGTTKDVNVGPALAKAGGQARESRAVCDNVSLYMEAIHMKADLTSRIPLRLTQSTRRAALFASILLLLGAVAGCSQSTVPVSFEGLCGLTHEQFEAMDETALVQWAQEKQGVTPSRMETETLGKLVVDYSWMKKDVSWHARLYNNELVMLAVDNADDLPTFGQIVDKIGPPKAVGEYVVTYERTMYEIILHYPHLGFSVMAVELTSGHPKEVVLTKRMQVEIVYCYKPGSMESVFEDAYLIPPDEIPHSLEGLLPWPGFGGKVPLGRSP